MTNIRDPYSDAWSVRADPPNNDHVNRAVAPRIPWPDGRVYRHTDGVLCGAGQNQTGLTYEGQIEHGPYGKVTLPREVTICTTHREEIVLAPRYSHVEDGSDCDATPANIRRGNWELECTLHERPVTEVW